MLKVLIINLVLLSSFYSFASAGHFNATLESLQSDFEKSMKPESMLFNGSYSCKTHNADAESVTNVNFSISSHGEWFVLTVNDDRDNTYTEIIVDNGEDYVSTEKGWKSILNRAYRINENGSLLIENTASKTEGVLVKPITSYNNKNLYVVSYILCARLDSEK